MDVTDETFQISQTFEVRVWLIFWIRNLFPEIVLLIYLTFQHKISLDGPTPIHSAQAEIDIPSFIEISGQSYELVLVRKPLLTYDGISHCKAVSGSFVENSDSSTSSTLVLSDFNQPDEILYDEINKDLSEDSNLIEITDGYSNRFLKNKFSCMKRTVGKFLYKIFTFHTVSEDENRVYKIRCENTGVICVKVLCDIKHLHEWSPAVIELKLRLKNEVSSKFSVFILNDWKIYQINKLFLLFLSG